MAVWHLNIPVNCLLVLRYFPPNRFVWNKQQHFIRIGLFLPKWINTPEKELQELSLWRWLQWTPEGSITWMESAARKSSPREAGLDSQRVMLWGCTARRSKQQIDSKLQHPQQEAAQTCLRTTLANPCMHARSSEKPFLAFCSLEGFWCSWQPVY